VAKRRAKKKTSKKKTKAAPPSAPAFVLVDMLVEPRHLEQLSDLARRFGCVSSRGDPAVADVLRAILDRYGDTMLRLAQPRPVGARARDEEE
jgi:hypothetical protein